MRQNTAAARPAVASDVAWVDVDGEVVALKPAEGTVHLLSPTASLIWRSLDGVSTVSEIASDIAAVFTLATDRALSEVSDAVADFAERDLLVGEDA